MLAEYSICYFPFSLVNTFDIIEVERYRGKKGYDMGAKSGFSWNRKRANGLSEGKQRFARITSIPTTRRRWERKIIGRNIVNKTGTK